MKKLIRLFLLLSLALALTACNNDSSEKETKSNDVKDETKKEEDTKLSGTVNITGSTSVAKILEDMINEFVAHNPDVTINYTGTGSSSGLQDAIDGNNDLGVASRELKTEEKDAGLENFVFAQDGVAVIVHPDNPLSELTTEQIMGIYAGEITSWSEVGGPEGAKINIMSREASSGTRSAFEELTGLDDHASGVTDDKVEYSSNGALQMAVAGDENAIGYVSFSYIDETIKPLKVDGGEATAEAVKAGDYPLSRPFQVVYMPEKASDLAKAFVDFMVSSEGQELVPEHGGIRID